MLCQYSANSFSLALGIGIMATISKRKKADGSIVYDARITFKDNGKLMHRESKTFSQKPMAQAWAKRREKEVEEQLAFTGSVTQKMTWAEAARHHLAYLESQDKLKRTKRTTIEFLLKKPIASAQLSEINSKMIVGHLRDRIINDGVKPQTVNNDLAYIGSVMRHAAVMLDIPVDLNALIVAKDTAWANNLVARSEKRERRLSDPEELTLLSYFDEHGVKSWMADIMRFALASARRQAEITRIKWSDLDEENSTIKVHDLKHPTLRGVTKTAKLSNEAMRIIQRQPKDSEFIFPRNHKTVSVYFTNACHLLEIEGLRFHDLRHEATSRLFEAGYSIIEVQHFTLHEDWKTLSRYTHLRPENVELRD